MGVRGQRSRRASVALRHLAEALAQYSLSPPLAAGAVADHRNAHTRAFPVAAGEEWSTKLTRTSSRKVLESLRLIELTRS